MGGFVMYITRPPSADELYAAVAQSRDGNEDAPLSSVEREIDMFLEQYSGDPRAAELRRYKNRLELEKRERQLRRKARDGSSADSSLLPVEQLYLRASDLGGSSPEEAAALFQSLVDLYGPSGKNHDDDVAAVVQLAKQRQAELRADLAKLHERQLTALRERMEVAERLSSAEPGQAAAMYRAMIELHGDDAWAADVVRQAQSRLANLEKEQ
jgi:hypothetical protein